MSPASIWANAMNVDAMLCSASVGVLLMRLYVPLSTRPVIVLMFTIALAMFDDTQEKYSMLLFTQRGVVAHSPVALVVGWVTQLWQWWTLAQQLWQPWQLHEQPCELQQFQLWLEPSAPETPDAPACAPV